MLKAIKSVLFTAVMLPVIAAQAATVTGTITNRTSGDPVSGAVVIIGTLNQGDSADTATTNARGAFSFTGVSTGSKTVLASMTGYQPGTGNVNVLQQNGSYNTNISLVPSTGGGVAGMISGTVKDSTTKEAIKSATVILSHPAGRGGATSIDTVLTDGEGRYSFAAVPPANNYIVVAGAGGYGSVSNSNVDVLPNDTVTASFLLAKLPVPSAVLSGKITDADSKAAITGAKVILRKRVLVGGQQVWQGLDSVSTSADGAYGFDSLAAATYSLLASHPDYVAKTSVNLVLANSQADTADIALVKIAKGSISFYVGLDSAGNPPLAGAAVAAASDAPTGDTYTGTTDAKGWVVFKNVIAGSYSVSANLAGYVSKVVTRTVAANEEDSGYVYLVRSTAQNSKSLSGLVRDAGGKAVTGAKVIFTANGINGIVLFATTTATGDYTFNGIPTGVAGGTVDVEKDGYLDFSSTVTLTGPASFLNITMKIPTSISNRALASDKVRVVRNGKGVFLEFSASTQTGSLSLYDARGFMIESARIPAGAVRADILADTRTGAGFVVLKQGAISRRLALPAIP